MMTESQIKDFLGVKSHNGSQLGIAPNSSMKNQKGLDPIDLEAARQGSAQGRIFKMVPKRKHIYS